MEKIDIETLGKQKFADREGGPFISTFSHEKALRECAEKINEIIEWINSKKDQIKRQEEKPINPLHISQEAKNECDDLHRSSIKEILEGEIEWLKSKNGQYWIKYEEPRIEEVFTNIINHLSEIIKKL